MRDLELERKKFFQMVQNRPVCVLHRQPDCKQCTDVYVQIVTRPIIRKISRQ